MSRSSLVTMHQEALSEEAMLEKKREEAVKLLSEKLRAEGSQTINQYCGLTEDGQSLIKPSPALASPTSAPATKRISPSTPLEQSSSDGPSPPKRTRGGEMSSSASRSASQSGPSASPSPPVAPLVKRMGRGRGRTALTIDHSRSYISQVYEVAQAMGWANANFKEGRGGPGHRQMFLVSCILNGEEYVAPQVTFKKQEGKELASLEALRSILGDNNA